MRYRFEIAGRFGRMSKEWFEGFSILEKDDRTILEGTIMDQSNLHGVLNHIRDLNLNLLHVHRIDEEINSTEKDQGE